MTALSKVYLKGLVLELTTLSKEAEWIEFKKDNGDPQMIGEYISALSNSAALCGKASGYLVWGVDDLTQEIVGTSFEYRNAKKGNEELEAWLSRLTSPKINFRFHEFFIDEKKLFYLRYLVRKLFLFNLLE